MTQFTCISILLYPFIYFSICLSIHHAFYPSIPSVHLSTNLCVQSFMRLSLYWPTPPTNPSLHLFILLLIHFSSHPYLHLLITHPFSSIYSSTYLCFNGASTYLPISPSPTTHLVFCLSTHSFLFISLLTHLSICPSTYLSTHPPT